MQKLIWEFLGNKKFITKFRTEYKDIIEYYDENNWFWYNWMKIIYDFINLNYSFLIKNKKIFDIKKIIIGILNYDFSDYCLTLSEQREDDNNSKYTFFYKYADFSIYNVEQENLFNNAKYNVYNEIFLKIKREFIVFLEEKIIDKKDYIKKLTYLDTKINNLWKNIDFFKNQWNVCIWEIEAPF